MNSQSYLSVTCQGMVEGKTYREKISGPYLTKEEQANLSGTCEDIKESWESTMEWTPMINMVLILSDCLCSLRYVPPKLSVKLLL